MENEKIEPKKDEKSDLGKKLRDPRDEGPFPLNADKSEGERDDGVDEASDESFPASDAPSHTPVTGNSPSH